MELYAYPVQEKIRYYEIEAIEIPIVYNRFGDPATPVFKAYSGERVVFRTMMPADKSRNTGFCIHGHEWSEYARDPHSRVISLQGAVSIGNAFNMELLDGTSCPGDYLYRSARKNRSFFRAVAGCSTIFIGLHLRGI